MTGKLEGRRILLTGAGSGIGRAAALRFTREGARVLAVDRTEGVDDTVDAVCADGGRALALRADAADEAALADAVARMQRDWGGIDGAWANAGIRGPQGPLSDQSLTDWEETLRVNLLGPFVLVKHVAPLMAEAGAGALLCTASVAALRAHAGGMAYSASKAGVVSLVQTTAAALAGTGVRVNAICPGLIETGMTAPIFDRARERGTEDRIGQLNPQRRPGRPEEIAAMACFLLSDDASYVNGQAIAVDGGLSSGHPFVPPRTRA
ncbi:MAG: SDR family NAD(P)-dependent oxidoreductase [Pseudomonadales bacterium]|jgi:NAD(P)-dependent dehydrogenase (short-subunit alcohol dehydrogenase family)|nr:SDR family NAD(P)-dependent oxidoreductase [Pseudomonadales bacterium]